MSVIQTNQWLKDYVRACSNIQQVSEFTHQEEILCQPLTKYFPSLNAPEIHQILMYGGLFAPIYFNEVEKRINMMEDRNIWTLVEDELVKLKKEWNGKDVDIFIFPINKDEAFFVKDLEGKNGLAYQNIIILFLDENAPLINITTLLTHEYNHVCRLRFLNTDLNKLSLKESLILEGLAEMAVNLRYGEEAIASFAKQYTKKQALQYWEQYLLEHLDVKGIDYHQKFLFGDEQIPKRLGYCVGYRIVESFSSRNKSISMSELLQTPTNHILNNSSYEMT